MANAANIERKWYVVDAEGQTVGRLAAEIAKVLRGKNKPTYTPHVDTGDYVIVVNADKVKFTGKKLIKKTYFRHSGYQGGTTFTPAGQMLDRFSTGVMSPVTLPCKGKTLLLSPFSPCRSDALPLGGARSKEFVFYAEKFYKKAGPGRRSVRCRRGRQHVFLPRVRQQVRPGAAHGEHPVRRVPGPLVRRGRGLCGLAN